MAFLRRVPKKLWIGSATVLAAAGLGFVGYMQLVRMGVLRYNKWDRRERGTLGVGDAAPDLELSLYDGGSVRLSELWRSEPVVLVFGSCT
jgi:hypothetical protein